MASTSQKSDSAQEAKQIQADFEEIVDTYESVLLVTYNEGMLGDTTQGFLMFEPEGAYTKEEMERVLSEQVTSAGHFLLRNKNPLKAILGADLDENDTPPLRSGDELHGMIRSSRTDLLEALEEADAAVAIVLESAADDVLWNEDDGAKYGAGSYVHVDDIAADGHDVFRKMLDHLESFVTTD